MMAAPTLRDLWDVLPAWTRATLILAACCLLVLAALPVLESVFFSPKKETAHAPSLPHPTPGRHSRAERDRGP
jgi:hypothetical protein